MEDIELINLLRYQISQFFYTKEQHINCYSSETQRMGSTFSLEHNLFKRQRKCRQILFQLLNRTRFKRKWFEEEQSPIFPNYQWNIYNQKSSQYYYRDFEFKEFSPSMLKTINMKTAVLTPISMPILNPDMPPDTWEGLISRNLTSLETENYE